MYRYIALIWNMKDPQKNDAARALQEQILACPKRWLNTYKQDGMMIFHMGVEPGRMQAYHLKGGIRHSGVILGKIFSRNQDYSKSSRDFKFTETESRRIIETEGQRLIEAYWGRYVAFLYDQFQGMHCILRDPTGAFPCLYVTWQGINIYFSDINDLLALNLLRFTINNKYLAAYLKYEFMQTSDTGLNDVFKLSPGGCHKITQKGTTSSFLWTPRAIYKKRIIEYPVMAAELLHNVTQDCVTSWAECHHSIFHRFSGGLDSSIVLSCLKHGSNPLDVTCLNYFTSSPDGDERRYARPAAETSQYKLLEKQLEPAAVTLEKILQMSKSAEPESYLFAIDRGDYETRMAEIYHPEAIFSGHGGDSIFFQPKTSLGASDYLYSHGLQPRFFNIALEAARLCDRSIWSVLCETFKRKLQRKQWHPLSDFLPEYAALIKPDVLESVNIEDILHPWIKDANDIPPGKHLHFMLATASPLYYEPSLQPDLNPPPVNPLYSQPLIELCLQIPTYLLTTGGRDRGLARMAFRNNVIPEIINRESKGAGDQYYTRVFKGNVKFIREFLLDGILLKENFIDGHALEEILAGNRLQHETSILQILSLTCTEAWLQHWYHRASPPGQF